MDKKNEIYIFQALLMMLSQPRIFDSISNLELLIESKIKHTVRFLALS